MDSAFLAIVALAAAGPLVAQFPATDTANARPDTAKAAPDTTPKITFDGYVAVGIRVDYGYWSSGRVWPARRPGDYSRDDGFVVTSLALTM